MIEGAVIITRHPFELVICWHLDLDVTKKTCNGKVVASKGNL